MGNQQYNKNFNQNNLNNNNKKEIKAKTPKDVQPIVPKVFVDENTRLDKLSIEELHSIYLEKIKMLKLDKYKYLLDIIENTDLKENDVKKISDKSFKMYNEFLKKKDADKKNQKVKDKKAVKPEKYDVVKKDALDDVKNDNDEGDYNGEDDFM